MIFESSVPPASMLLFFALKSAVSDSMRYIAVYGVIGLSPLMKSGPPVMGWSASSGCFVGWL